MTERQQHSVLGAQIVSGSRALALPIAILILWILFAGEKTVIPPPGQVIRSIGNLWQKDHLAEHVVITLRRVIVGYTWGLVLGIVLGVVTGLHRVVQQTIEPLLGLLRPLAPMAWVPLSLLWFGISHAAAEFIIAYASFFPVYTNTVQGIQQVSSYYIEAARTLGARRRHLIRNVYFPGASSYILAGARIAFGLSLAVVIGAELAIGYPLGSGVGFLMIQYLMVYFDAARILALILVVGSIGFVVDRIIRIVEGLLTPWRRGLKLGGEG